MYYLSMDGKRRWNKYKYLTRDGIPGYQFDKRLESFAPCYSQSLLHVLADLKKTIIYFGFKNIYELESFHKVESQTKT